MPKHGPSLGGGRVDALLEHLQADSPLTQLGAEGDQMQHGPTEPVQPRDRQGVAFAQHFEQHIELRAGGLRPAGGVQIDEVFSTDWSFGGGQYECRFGDGADALRAQPDAAQRLPAGLEQRDPAFAFGA